MNPELPQSIGDQVWSKAERDPDLHTLTRSGGITGKTKRCGHHPNDGVRLLIKLDRAAEDVGVTSILVLPQLVCKHYDIAGSGQCLSLGKASAERRRGS